MYFNNIWLDLAFADYLTRSNLISFNGFINH